MKKILSFFLIALAAITVGAMLTVKNNRDIHEAQRFRSLFHEAETAAEMKDARNLRKSSDDWEHAANSTKDTIVAAKSLYNKGWVNIELLKESGEVSAYLAARNSLREALRKNPGFFDAKLNLVYLENLAKEKGIKPEEVPVSSNVQPQDSAQAGPPPQNGIRTDGNRDNQEGEKRDLRDKIKGGAAPGLGGEPPADLYEKPGREDFQELPSLEY